MSYFCGAFGSSWSEHMDTSGSVPRECQELCAITLLPLQDGCWVRVRLQGAMGDTH